MSRLQVILPVYHWSKQECCSPIAGNCLSAFLQHSRWQEKSVSLSVLQRINNFSLVLSINRAVNQVSFNREQWGQCSSWKSRIHFAASLHTYQQMQGVQQHKLDLPQLVYNVALQQLVLLSLIQLDFFKQLGKNFSSAAWRDILTGFTIWSCKQETICWFPSKRKVGSCLNW